MPGPATFFVLVLVLVLVNVNVIVIVNVLVNVLVPVNVSVLVFVLVLVPVNMLVSVSVSVGVGFSASCSASLPAAACLGVKAVLGWAAEQEDGMSQRFETQEVTLEMAAQLRPALEALARRDRSLEDQVRRAAASVVLNLAEGAGRRGKDRVQHYRIAAGSAGETAVALRLAKAWGYVDADEVKVAEALLARVQAMLWKLTRGG